MLSLCVENQAAASRPLSADFAPSWEKTLFKQLESLSRHVVIVFFFFFFLISHFILQTQGQLPYKALMAALSAVLQRINLLDSAVRRKYVESLHTSLGNSAALLLPLLPSLRPLLADIDPPTNGISPVTTIAAVNMSEEQSSSAVQARLSEALLNLVVSCASSSGLPLVLCIDDLQWADPTSLALLSQLLMALATDGKKHLRLLLVGAYRTGEASTATVQEAIGHLRREGLTLAELELGVLSAFNVHSLLEELFPTRSEMLDALTNAVMRKTLGNAFFVLHFLQGLYQDSLIRFDFDAGSWVFDLV